MQNRKLIITTKLNMSIKAILLTILLVCIVLCILMPPVHAQIGGALEKITSVGSDFSIDAIYASGSGQFVDAVIYFLILFMMLYPTLGKRYAGDNDRVAAGLSAVIALALSLSIVFWGYSRSPPFQLMTSLGEYMGFVLFIIIIGITYSLAKTFKAGTGLTVSIIGIGLILLLDSPIGEPLKRLLFEGTGSFGTTLEAFFVVVKAIALVVIIYWLLIKLPSKMFGGGGHK